MNRKGCRFLSDEVTRQPGHMRQLRQMHRGFIRPVVPSANSCLLPPNDKLHKWSTARTLKTRRHTEQAEKRDGLVRTLHKDTLTAGAGVELPTPLSTDQSMYPLSYSSVEPLASGHFEKEAPGESSQRIPAIERRQRATGSYAVLALGQDVHGDAEVDGLLMPFVAFFFIPRLFSPLRGGFRSGAVSVAASLQSSSSLPASTT
ncbi:hypothetical protein KUCAC02_034608, partial [Chaenocephalus aceratus]